MRYYPGFLRLIPRFRAGCLRVTRPFAARVELPLLPLDLHFSGMPQAFVLSQDQTLRQIHPPLPLDASSHRIAPVRRHPALPRSKLGCESPRCAPPHRFPRPRSRSLRLAAGSLELHSDNPGRLTLARLFPSPLDRSFFSIALTADLLSGPALLFGLVLRSMTARALIHRSTSLRAPSTETQSLVFRCLSLSGCQGPHYDRRRFSPSLVAPLPGLPVQARELSYSLLTRVSTPFSRSCENV